MKFALAAGGEEETARQCVSVQGAAKSQSTQTPPPNCQMSNFGIYFTLCTALNMMSKKAFQI